MVGSLDLQGVVWKDEDFSVHQHHVNVLETESGLRLRVQTVVMGVRVARLPDGSMARGADGMPLVSVDFQNVVSMARPPSPNPSGPV